MKKVSSWLYKTTIVMVYLGIITAIGITGYLYYLSQQLPSLDELVDPKYDLPTQVYDRNNRLITEFYTKRRSLTPISEIPDIVIKALLAIEDKRFYHHIGIDPIRMFGAFIKNLKSMRYREGGSTLTQQTAKQFLLSHDKKLKRKLKEILLAIQIERRFSKEKILELYLNKAPFGHGAYGIGAAAQSYFSKTPDELTLPEAAMLVGMPQRPSRWAPTYSRKNATKRRNIVLRMMREAGYITTEEMEKAITTPIVLKLDKSIDNNETSYYVEHVRRYLLKQYGADQLYRGGMKVYTTMDLDAQIYAQQSLTEGLYQHDKRQGYRGSKSNVWEEVLRELDMELYSEKNGMDLDAFQQLSSEEQETAKAFYQQKTEKITQKNHFVIGGKLNGVVSKVNKGIARVDLGDYQGTLNVETMRWARPVNYKERRNSKNQLKDLRDILKSGDVIELEILDYGHGEGEFVLALTQKPVANGGIFVMDPRNGHVLAMSGGIDFQDSEFNRAIQSLRQPGSAFKPIVYSLALDNSFTTASILKDQPIVLDGWKPNNYSKGFKGHMTLREALVHSKNNPTISLSRSLGAPAIIEQARKLGLTTKMPDDLTIGLGTGSVTLEELVQTYSVFANGGLLVEPIYFTKILDRNGSVLEEHAETAKEEVLSEQTAYLTTSILHDVVRKGSGWRARAIQRPAAGKTGTTNNYTDAWFMGFVPQLTAGVYVGFDNSQRSLGEMETGSRAAAPIWTAFMKQALATKEILPFSQPEGIQMVRIDPKTGALDCVGKKGAVMESFKSGTAPTVCQQEASVVPAENEDYDPYLPPEEGGDEEL